MGQSIKELIDGETSLVGVLGDPVKHSLSPVIHNAALTALNLNWCYLAIPCKQENFKIVVKALRNMDCKGLNITIPHKQKALEICTKIESTAQHVGAVNTLIPIKQDNWYGANTDVEGFLNPLNNFCDWNKKKVIILGCGGSCKAVIYGLLSLKVSQIIIINRNKNTLDSFLNYIKKENIISCEIFGLTSNNLSIPEYIKNADLIINTTPVGMSKSKTVSELPLGNKIWEHLKPGIILYDLIYTPNPTKWLKLGEKLGCHTIDGLEMLIQQGAASLRLWSGIETIPIDIMRKAAQKSLKNSN